MDKFLQYFVVGLSNGAIYASLALAIVILIQTMRQPNISQGEIATFSTFVAWYMISRGIPYWVAVGLTLVFAFFWGAFLQRVFYKPVEQAGPNTQLIVLIGLFLGINGLSGWLFGYHTRAFPRPFASNFEIMENAYISINQLFSLFVIGVLIITLTLFYRFTKVGLGLRALSQNPTSCSLMGINTSLMLMVNWGVASIMGCVAGILAAPTVFLDKNMMATALIYAFAGCLIGGIYSPVGAVVGCFIVSVFNVMIFDYFKLFDSGLALIGTFVLILVVMLVKPGGLFAKKIVSRM